MVLDRAVRFLVLAAFVLAQAAALTHSIWHISFSVDGVRSADSASQDPSGNPLCTQHGALDDVLGAVHGAPPSTSVVNLAADSALAAVHASASLAALAPSSRGPPAFL
jgi:hypothetical protein